MPKLLFICWLALTATAFAGTTKKYRPYYGGSKHTRSHGGSYSTTAGSSHKHGHYRGPSGNKHYGRHKIKTANYN